MKMMEMRRPERVVGKGEEEGMSSARLNDADGGDTNQRNNPGDFRGFQGTLGTSVADAGEELGKMGDTGASGAA